MIYILLPMGFVGSAGPKLVETYDYLGAMNKIMGTNSAALTDFLAACLVASFVITMNTATADGGRALYGVSRAGSRSSSSRASTVFTCRGIAMTVDMIVNILFVLFVGNLFGILAASNLGYVLAHVFTLSAFILLRKDRPDWPRPIRLGSWSIPLAGVLCAYCILITIVGFGWFQNAAGGYGGTKEKIIGISVLVIAVLLFLYRRIVQDRERPHWREETPTQPPAGYFEAHGIVVPTRAK